MGPGRARSRHVARLALANLIVDFGGLGAHGKLPRRPAQSRHRSGWRSAAPPPTCEGLVDALTDHAATDLVATTEDLAALAL